MSRSGFATRGSAGLRPERISTLSPRSRPSFTDRVRMVLFRVDGHNLRTIGLDHDGVTRTSRARPSCGRQNLISAYMPGNN